MHLNKLNVGFLMSFLSFAAVLSLPAATLKVPSEHGTILAALTAARAGDTVLISEATYSATATGSSEGLYPIVVPPGVTLAGNGATPADTVIDAEGAGRILTLGAGAVVRNLTLANAHLAEGEDAPRGMALDVRGGTVEDCVIRGCQNDATGCGHFVLLDGGTMRRTTVTGCTTGGDFAWGGNKGAAVYAVNGSLLEGVTVSGNTVEAGSFSFEDADHQAAAPVVLDGGSRMTGSQVCDNIQGYTEGQPASGGVLMLGGSRLEASRIERNQVPYQYAGLCTGGVIAPDWNNCVIDRCVICDNRVGPDLREGPATGGGILVGIDCVLRNSLVAGNVVDNGGFINECGGGMLVAATARIENCTVVDNVYGGNTAASGIDMIWSGENAIVNTIIWNNGLDSEGGEVCGGVVTYSLTPTPLEGEGNVSADPCFANAAEGDYSLLLRSPCVDAGTEIEAVTNDLAGTARPQDGKSSGTARTDIGCYERPPSAEPLSCALTVESALVAAPYDTVVSAEVFGDATGATYHWTCFRDGVEYGSQDTLVATCTFEDLEYGRYTFAVSVRNGAGDVASDTSSPDSPLTVGAQTSYVSAEGLNEWPYASPETAAANLKDAVGASVGKVIVLAGTYGEMEHETDAETGVDYVAVVRRALLVEGAGPDTTVIDCAGGGGIFVAHADAAVSGLRIVNAVADQERPSVALNVVSGLASNVVVCGGESYGPSGAGAAVQVRGVFADGAVTGFAAGGWQGAPVLQVHSDGVLRGVTVADNHADTLPLVVAAERTLIENCAITNNSSYSSVLRIGDHYAGGGTIAGCTLTGNFHRDGATVWLEGGSTMRRCRLQGNSATDVIVYSPAWDENWIENCLIADNRVDAEKPVILVDEHDSTLNMSFTTVAGNSSTALSGGILCNEDGSGGYARLTARNCIFWGNAVNGVGSNVTGNSPSMDLASSCYPEATPTEENRNLASDPVFAAPADGDYQLKLSSPCVDSADDSGEEPVAVDLIGVERPQDGKGTGNRVSDRGCYEFVPSSDPLVCELSVPATIAAAPASVTLTATVGGEHLEGLAFAWAYVRTYNGEESRVEQPTDKNVHTFENLGYGRYVFEVKVTNDWGDEVTVRSAPVTVSAATCYVSPSGGHVWPFDSVPNAATNFTEAIAAAVVKVVVKPGDYSGVAHVTDEMTGLDVLAAVRRPVAVEGEGPGTTVVDCAGAGGFLLADRDARLSGLSIVNACVRGDADICERVSALRVEVGVASNLVVRGGEAFRSQAHAGVEMVGGLFVDGVVTGFTYHDWGANPVYAEGATLRNVRIADNSQTSTAVNLRSGATLEKCTVSGNWSHQAVIEAEGVSFSDCLIESNTCESADFYVRGGTFARCRFVGNRVGAAEDASLLYVQDYSVCALKNCLVADNVSQGGFGLLFVSPGNASLQLVNTTVAGNSTVGYGCIWACPHPDWEDLCSEFSAVNSVIWGNTCDGEPSDIGGGSPNIEVTYSCYASAEPTEENHNLNAAPRFKSDYRLRASSPCLNAGDASVWGEADAPTDLVGAPRLDRKGRVDMGCYQTTVRGMAVLIY